MWRGGGDRGARTPNLGIANAALSQLSYIPTLCGRPDYTTGLADPAKTRMVPSRASRMLALPGSCLGGRTPFGSAAILAARPWLGMRLHRPQQGQQDAGAPREPSWRQDALWERRHLGGKTSAGVAAPPSPAGPGGCWRSQGAILAALRLLGAPPSWRQDLGWGCGSTVPQQGQQDAGAPREPSWCQDAFWERRHLGGKTLAGNAAPPPQQGQQDAGAPREPSWRHCGSWERRHLGGKTLAWDAAPPSPTGPAGCRRSQEAILAALRLLGAPPRPVTPSRRTAPPRFCAGSSLSLSAVATPRGTHDQAP